MIGNKALLPQSAFKRLVELAQRYEGITVQMQEDDGPTLGIIRSSGTEWRLRLLAGGGRHLLDRGRRTSVMPPTLSCGDVVLTRFPLTEAAKNIMAEHSNKHIQEAIRYAEGHGWVVTQAGPRAHIWGMLWCPHHARDGCRIHIMSTPRSPENHARDIRRAVDRCPHT